MPFNYPWTCEAIDSNLTQMLDTIRKCFVEHFAKLHMIDSNGFTPDMWSDIEIATQDLYNDLRDCIEAIRLTNSGIRTAAEDQVVRLENDLDDANDELYEHCRTIHDLERQIVELEFVIHRDNKNG